jgi:hypothetical protein
MKNFLLKSISAAALLFGLTANVAYAQTTYPMVCRGATDLNTMQFAIGPQGSSFLAEINFTKSPGPSWWGIEPGHCTWLDRAIYPQEPSRLMHIVQQPLNGYLFVGPPSFGTGNGAPFSFNMGGITASLIPYFPNYINQLMVNGELRSGTLYDPNQYYTFNVFNDASINGFRIVSIRCAGICS